MDSLKKFQVSSLGQILYTASYSFILLSIALDRWETRSLSFLRITYNLPPISLLIQGFCKSHRWNPLISPWYVTDNFNKFFLDFFFLTFKFVNRAMLISSFFFFSYYKTTKKLKIKKHVSWVYYKRLVHITLKSLIFPWFTRNFKFFPDIFCSKLISLIFLDFSLIWQKPAVKVTKENPFKKEMNNFKFKKNKKRLQKLTVIERFLWYVGVII